MTPLRVLLSRLLDLVLHGRREARLSEEIQTHLTLLTDDFMARGLSPADARAAARRAFGGADQIAATYRDQRGFPAIDSLALDFRLGARLLMRDRSFTIVATLVLALGIGVNTMLFTILNAHTIRGLPISRADRVVHLSLLDQQNQPADLTYEDVALTRQSSRTLAAVGAFASAPAVLADADHAPDRVDAASISSGLFEVIPPALVSGRLFTAEEEATGAAAVALMSDRLWHSRYGRAATVYDTPVLIDRQPVRIIGIFSAKSRLPLTADVWLPLRPPDTNARAPRGLQVIGRMNDRARITDVRSEIEAIAVSRRTSTPAHALKARAVPINERYFGRLTDTAWLAFITVGFLVVLISCANVANLMIDRSLHRAREIAIRTSIGASRGRLVRQLLVEATVLAALGGTVGLGIAVAGVRLFSRAIPANVLPYWFDYTLDWRVVAMLIGVSAFTVLAFGLVPAFGASRVDPNQVLKAGANIEGRSRTSRSSTAFLTVELALTVLMLANLTLGIRNANPEPPAERLIPTGEIVTATVSATGERYASAEQRAAFFQQLEEQMGTMPGVAAASVATMLPMSESTDRRLLGAGSTTFPIATAPAVSSVTVGPGYFRAIGLNLVSGREFQHRQSSGGPQEAIVNERFAEMFLDGHNPVGARLVLRAVAEAAPPLTLEIIGEAPTFRQNRRPTADPVVFLPYDVTAPASLSLVVRSAGDHSALVTAMRQTLLSLDRDIPLYRVRTLAQALDDAAWNGRVSSNLIHVLTGLALGLSMVGLYAVTAHAASRRSREIGVRMALGAQARDIRLLILRKAGIQVALGFAAGVACTFVWGWLFASSQASVTITNIQSLAMAAIVLALVAAIATLVPARRATRVNPISVLRHE